MADWTALFRSNDFRSYRKKQAEMVASYLNDVVFQMVTGGKIDPTAFQGQMKVVKMFLELPATLTQDKEVLAILGLQTEEDIANITKFLVRRNLNAE